MAKKRKSASGAATPASPSSTAELSRGARRRRAAKAARASNPASTLGSAEEPAFFFGFELSWAKLVLGRVLVFALLAIDSLTEIAHAPRYGAGGFNVAQLPLLDALAPTRPLYSIGQLLVAYLLVFAACGVATRVVLPIATLLYGWLYFGSHLDSYQHHYLVWLLLLLSCFVPWERPSPEATANTRVRSWAMRLILIQLAIVYFYAAISKLGDAWLDGRALSMQVHGTLRSMIDSTVGIAGAAWIVLLSELALAATIWCRRTWFVAAPLGLGLHLGILSTDLEIGMFAELMLALYVFVISDRVWTWLASLRPLPTLRAIAGVIAGWFEGAAGWLPWVAALAAGLILGAVSRFDHGWPVALALSGALVVGSIALRKRVSIVALAMAHLLALVTWTGVDRATKTASDYYRFWGGSSRRLGDAKTSEHAYRRMTEVAPHEGGGHYQLGKLLLSRDANSEEGVKHLERAQQLEPFKARAYIAQARWLATVGRRDEAIAKLREAMIVEPNNAEVRNLLNSLGSR